MRFSGELVFRGPYPGTMSMRRLPCYRVDRWLEDRPRRPECSEREPRITEKGYRLGQKPGNHGRKFPPSPPTPTEVMRMLDLLPLNTKRGVRNRALIATLWRSGLRISEALALRPHHVDFEAKTLTVECGKGGKYRVSGVDDGALAEISRWLFVRAMLGIKDPARAPLFCSVNQPRPGQPMWSAYVREMLAELALQAGVPRRVAPHQLRHCFAVELVREGVGVRVVQLALGHSSLATTANYLQAISGGEAADYVGARSWPEATS